jgi:hydrogenase nickel incorporation protein HypB
LVVQLLASPGAGKTTLLEVTASRLNGATMAVLVGDLATERDAERIRRVAPCIPLTTGGACHLEMSLVEAGFAKLDKAPVDFLFIEDVGNLVCPASHDVGQHERVTLLSVTEGDDKAGKYPKAFRTSQTLVISKIDLLPYVPFSMENAFDDARRIQPLLHVMRLSSLTGEGLDGWISFLTRRRDAMIARGDYVDASRQEG